MTNKFGQQHALKSMGISTRIWLAFVLIISMFIVMGIIGTQSLNSLSELTHKMYRHPFTVSNAVREIQYRITAMHRDMKYMAATDSSKQIQQISRQLDEHERQVFLTFDLIQQRFLGNLSQVNNARETFINWRPIRRQVIEYMVQPQHHKARESILKQDDNHVQVMEQSIASLLKYANNKAKTFLQHTAQQRDSTIEVFWIIVASLSFIVVLTGFMIVYAIVRPIIRISKSLEQLALGDVTGEISDMNRRDEIGIIVNAINGLQQSSKKLSENACRIAKGDLSVEIEIRSENDFLARSMATMLSKQRQSSFISGGINQLNEVMRGNQDIMELSEKIIRFLCQYTQSELGCFYLNQSGWIHNVANYATEPELMPPDVFKVGEGLVGETAVQKKILFNKDLPPDYISICSASGKTLLRTVIVIPVILNDEVVALIEFGRMVDLSEDHLKFIEVINLPIAIAVNAVIINAEEQCMVYTNDTTDD